MLGAESGLCKTCIFCVFVWKSSYLTLSNKEKCQCRIINLLLLGLSGWDGEIIDYVFFFITTRTTFILKKTIHCSSVNIQVYSYISKNYKMNKCARRIACSWSLDTSDFVMRGSVRRAFRTLTFRALSFSLIFSRIQLHVLVVVGTFFMPSGAK